MRYNPRSFTTKEATSQVPSVEEQLKRINEARNQLADSWNKAKQLGKIAIRPKYAQGDKVWLEGTNIRTTQPSAKLSAKRYGPF